MSLRSHCPRKLDRLNELDLAIAGRACHCYLGDRIISPIYPTIVWSRLALLRLHWHRRTTSAYFTVISASLPLTAIALLLMALKTRTAIAAANCDGYSSRSPHSTLKARSLRYGFASVRISAPGQALRLSSERGRLARYALLPTVLPKCNVNRTRRSQWI